MFWGTTNVHSLYPMTNVLQTRAHSDAHSPIYRYFYRIYNITNERMNSSAPILSLFLASVMPVMRQLFCFCMSLPHLEHMKAADGLPARLFVEPFLLPFHFPCLAVCVCSRHFPTAMTESESVKVCAEAGIELVTRTFVLCSRLAIYGPTELFMHS